MAVAAVRALDQASPDDAELVRRVVGGERELFELLMRRYNQRLYRVIHAVLRDQGEVQDAMQQAWLQAWRRLGQLQSGAAFPGWLCRIGANEALARRRGRALQPPLAEDDDMDPCAPNDPEADAIGRELARTVEAAVDRLPGAQRAAFMLRDVEGLPAEEAAALLGVGPEVLKVRLHRARLALRAELGRAAGLAPDTHRFLADRCDPMVAWVMARLAAEPAPREHSQPGERQPHPP